jgi:hypothetical protein
VKLGGTGIWNARLAFGDPGEMVEAAGELNELGYINKCLGPKRRAWALDELARYSVGIAEEADPHRRNRCAGQLHFYGRPVERPTRCRHRLVRRAGVVDAQRDAVQACMVGRRVVAAA